LVPSRMGGGLACPPASLGKGRMIGTIRVGFDVNFNWDMWVTYVPRSVAVLFDGRIRSHHANRPGIPPVRNCKHPFEKLCRPIGDASKCCSSPTSNPPPSTALAGTSFRVRARSALSGTIFSASGRAETQDWCGSHAASRIDIQHLRGHPALAAKNRIRNEAPCRHHPSLFPFFACAERLATAAGRSGGGGRWIKFIKSGRREAGGLVPGPVPEKRPPGHGPAPARQER